MPQTLFSGGKTLMYNAGIEAVREYVEGKRVKAYNPKVVLEISPFIPPGIPIEFMSENMGGIITNVAFDKSRSTAAGSFTVTMAADDQRVAANMPVGYPLRYIWASQGESLRDLFRPMTLAKLWLDGYHVATGHLDEFKKRTEPGKREYRAVFSELGAIYNNPVPDYQQILFGIEARIMNDPTKVIGQAGTQFALPLALSMSLYVNAFLASSLAYGSVGFPTPYFRASDGIPMAARMIAQMAPIGGIALNSFLARNVTDATLFEQAGGTSFWEFLKSLAPEPFMELFTESGGRTVCTGRIVPNVGAGAAANVGNAAFNVSPLRAVGVTPMLPGLNYLICRSVPYDNPLLGFTPWLDIYSISLGVMDLLISGDFIIITDDDVVEKDLGVSGRQQNTAFYFEAKSKGSGDSWKFPPSLAGGPINPIFPGGIRTFGLRSQRAGLPSTSLHWGGILTENIERIKRVVKDVPTYSTLLKIYFRNASKFNEGHVTTRWMPYARPGMLALYLPPLSGSAVDDTRDLGMYYIDNLQHSYTNTGAPTTTYSLIRGTPLPINIEAIAALLMEWECFPPGLNIVDGEPY